MRMKRQLIFAVALVLCMNALLPTAVWAKEQDPNMVMCSSKDSYEAACYYYYANGALAQKKLENGDIRTYQYRKDGSLEKEILTYADEGGSYVTEYDKKGNPTAEYSILKGKRSMILEYQNYYDDEGRIQEIRTLPDDSLMSSITSYTYGEDGSWKVEESDYMVYEDQPIPHCSMATTYNADGLVSTVELTLCDMETMDTVTGYTYDAHGNLATKFCSWFEEDMAHRDAKYIYDNSYNADENLVKTEVWLENDTTWKKTLEQTITYTYNTQGLMTKKLTHDAQNDYDTMDFWEYDAYGNVTHFKGSVYVDGGIGKGHYEEEERWFAYCPLENVLYKG